MYFLIKNGDSIAMFWVVPPPSNSGNEGLGWDSLLKMVHNTGGDWHPGKGDNPSYVIVQTRGFFADIFPIQQYL